MSVFYWLYRILRTDNKFRFWCVWKMFLVRERGNENFLSGSPIASDGKNIENSPRLIENFWLRKFGACLPFRKSPALHLCSVLHFLLGSFCVLGKLLIQSLEWSFQILSKWTYSEDLRDVNFSHVCMKHKPVNQLVNLCLLK